MEAPLKICAPLASVSCTVQNFSHPGWQTDCLLTLRFQTRTFQIHPLLNILTLPNWLFKSHHSIIESTVKIWILYFYWLTCVPLFPYRTSIICVNNYPARCNNIHFIYICKLLYVFRLVSPPTISSSCHRIYRSLLLPVLIVTAVPIQSRSGQVAVNVCRHGDISCWRWVEIPAETRTAVYRYK